MNPRSQKLTIPLTSRIDLTRNKIDVSQFTDFEEKNSPVYGESLSPLYSKKVENVNYAVFDTKGNKYTFIDNVLYKNDNEIMRTRGNGYFEINEVTEPKDWDTYDKVNGHTVKSKYENGLIRYYYDDTEYRWNASSAANSIVACRSRILPDGTPITAYVLATTTANLYQFVFLSKTLQGVYNTNTVMNGVWTNQALPTAAQGGGAQNRAAAISCSNQNVAVNDKGFLNPLIQIASPLPNVYIVSFISNHGGKIDANTEIRFFNMMWNGNTNQWFSYFNMNPGAVPSVDIPYSRNLSLRAIPTLSRNNKTGVCYKYNIPSGDPDYDAAHQADAGKYFTAVGPNNSLINEIKFDEGYEPTWANSFSDTDGHILYQSYNYAAHDDVLTVQLQSYGLTSGDYLNPSLSYTPKVKTTANEEQYDFNHIRYQTYGDDNLPLYTKNGDNYEIVYKKKLIPNSGTDKEIYAINDKTAYQYRPKWNSAFADNSYLHRTNYYVYLQSGAANDPLYRLASEPNRAIRRDIHSTVDKNGNPIAPGTILSYDQYPVCYTEEQAYHEATIGETWNGVLIETAEDCYETDVAGNKIPATVAYWKQINGTNDILVPMSYEDVQPYTDVPQKYMSKSGEVDIKSTLYRTYFEIKYVTTWTDGTPATFTSSFANGDGTATWTFKYENNYLDYEATQLWSGFNHAINIVSKGGGASQITTSTDPLNVINGNVVSWSHDFEWTVAAAANHVTVPNVVLDDGSFVWVGDFPRSGFNAGAQPFVWPLNVVFAFQARADYMIDGATFHYIATGYYNTGTDVNTPGCVLTNTIDIGPNYYRTILNLTNSTGSAVLAPIGMQVLYDSATHTSYIDAGGLSSDATTGSGWYDAKYYNTQGSIAGSVGNWRYLYNSGGLLSNLSYGEDGYIGTLLAEWNSIADDKYVYGDENTIGWHSTDGKWYEVTLKSGVNSNISIIFDRYVVIPTNGFWNCYDIDKSMPLHYASDFNNRVLAGVSQTKYTLDSAYNIAQGKTTGYSTTKMFVTGQNAMYEVSGVAVTSVQISPQPYINICTGFENFIWCRSDPLYLPQKIEVFYGNTNNGTTADYQYSMTFYGATSIMTKDPNLVGLVSPVAIAAATYYSPNIFSEFIKTYNNKDLVKNGSYSYPIVYSETTPILCYSSAKQLTNVDAVFVIQSQFYALIGGKIVSVVYDDYSIVGIDAIIDITGMKYLGYLPTKAYFWSQANRSLYSFTGDANLSLEMEANSISEVYDTYYSTQKEMLFITTDRGTYVLGDIQMYHIDTGIVKKIWFVNDGYFIVEGVDNELKYYSYEKDLIPVNDNEVVTKVPVKVETKYYGIGDGQVQVVDKVSVMFRSDSLEEGNIYFKCSTLTDVGFSSEEKKYHINANNIDKMNNSFIINYTPRYGQGQGFKVDILSDFPIVRITESMSGMQQNTSSSHNL